MDVFERSKVAFGHLIYEQMRAFKRDNLDCQPLSHTKDLTCESDPLTKTERTRNFDRALGFSVDPNISDQVETSCRRSIYLSFEV